MISYAITFGLVFGGIILALPWLGEKVPALTAIGDGLTKFSTIIGAFVGIGGVLGIVFGIPMMLVSFVGGLLVLIGSGLATVVGLLLLVNFLRNRKEVPQEKLEALNSKLNTFQVPIGLAGVVYGLFMLVAQAVLF